MIPAVILAAVLIIAVDCPPGVYRCGRDVQRDGYCPTYQTLDWQCLADLQNCNMDTAYHCAKDEDTSKYEEVCATIVTCRKGEEPFIRKTKNSNSEVICKHCKDNKKFNPDGDRQSNTFSKCSESKTDCSKESGKIVCAKYEDERQYSENIVCRCDIENDYVTKTPSFKGYCTNSTELRCMKAPCPLTDGKRSHQRLMSTGWQCFRMCPDGLFRNFSSNTDPEKCVPKLAEKSTSSIKHATTSTFTRRPATIASSSPALTVDPKIVSTVAPSVAPTVISEDDGSNQGDKSDQNKWLIPVTVICVMGLIVIGIFLYRKCKRENRKPRRKEDYNLPDGLTFLDFSKRALNRSTVFLKEKMKPDDVLDQFRANSMYENTNSIRDIGESQNTTKKNGAIIEFLKKKDVADYFMFKECLYASEQHVCVDALEENEDEIITKFTGLSNGNHSSEDDSTEEPTEEHPLRADYSPEDSRLEEPTEEHPLRADYSPEDSRLEGAGENGAIETSV